MSIPEQVDPGPPPSPPVGRLEAAVVAAVTLAFAAWARGLPYDDWPLGDGWNRYLANAIAIAEGDWRGYLPWRGPVHAWLSLALTPLAGSLVRASQWLSLVTTALLLPLGWALGRRLGGRLGGMLALGLLLGWPDLRLFAWYSSPYPLQGVLLAGGALLALSRVPGRTAVARGGTLVAAGLCLGLGAATDARAAVSGGLLLLGLATGGAAPALRALAIGVVAAALGAGLIQLIPVDLYSVGELARLQHQHVSPLVPACGGNGGPADLRPLGLAELLGPCGQGMLALNLARLAGATPIPAALVALLALVGVAPGRGLPLSPRLACALPVLALLPSAVLVALQHRYFVPLAPFGAALVAAGLVRLARGTRVGAGLAAGAVLTGALAWHLGGPTLLTRGAGNRGANATASLDNPGVVASAAWRVRDSWIDGPVLDCANGNLRERLWPIPVETWKPRGAEPATACRRLLEAPAVPGWILVRPGPGLTVGAGWHVVLGGAPGPTLYRGE